MISNVFNTIVTSVTEVKTNGRIVITITPSMAYDVLFYGMLVVASLLLAADSALVYELLKAILIGWVVNKRAVARESESEPSDS